jgi:hypothetical protein
MVRNIICYGNANITYNLVIDMIKPKDIIFNARGRNFPCTRAQSKH